MKTVTGPQSLDPPPIVTQAVDSRLLALAATIIEKSSRQNPADAILREQLRNQRGLNPKSATVVTNAVFAYYRWFGWLAGADIETRVEHGMKLAEAFAKKPEQFPDSELLDRVVPGWIKDEMLISPGWARSLQMEPVLWLRARRGEGREIKRELANCRIFGEGQWEDTLEYLGNEDLFRSPAFHIGRFEIQDLASQAVGFVCNPQPGESWWDACSGEGGKTLHLSDLMNNKGLIWASDRAKWRLLKLKRRTARAGVFNYRSALWDGSSKLPTKTKFEGVLLDAPCSGVGTWQRNPHARWTTTLADIQELGQLQQRLLSNASSAVKTGGRLFYSVCTLTRTETSEVQKAFETQHPEFERLLIEHPITGDRTPALWIWPQDYRSNGMFVAGWKRK